MKTSHTYPTKMADLPSLITSYFDLGSNDEDIKLLLRREHALSVSVRQVRRIRKDMNLSKRYYSNPNEVFEFVSSELEGSGQLHGYRIMHAKCLREGLKVRMEDVRLLLKQLDPIGVEIRRSRRLRRRAYYAAGPNYIWHLDGYDKLKPFGLPIHGCICGFSRQVIWLNVYHTNNDPKIVGGYFVEAIQEYNGCPLIVRGDFGTENGHVRDMQKFLRGEGHDQQEQRCYLDGASTANQRIEAWWGFLRKECVHFWIDHFRNLTEAGDFAGDALDKSIVQFCFMAILQNELDTVAQVWNTHTIRPSRNPRVPSGRPFVMHHLPDLWGAEDKLCPVSNEDLQICKEECTFRSAVPCDADVFKSCTQIMHQEGLEPADNLKDATDLYLFLRSELRG